MALITLPNTASWDTELNIFLQTQEAQEYAKSLIDAGENVALTEEEYCMQDWQDNAMNRPTKRVYEDTPNNLKLQETFDYINLPSSAACMAVKGTNYLMVEV